MPNIIVTVACIVPHGNLLLVGVGMLLELVINFINGGSLKTLFKPAIAASDNEMPAFEARFASLSRICTL